MKEPNPDLFAVFVVDGFSIGSTHAGIREPGCKDIVVDVPLFVTEHNIAVAWDRQFSSMKRARDLGVLFSCPN